MDMKRFAEIEGREAMEILLNGQSVYNSKLQEYQIENETLVRSFGDIKKRGSALLVSEILSGTWYIKKPFDVRAEMLARPNEWVGAYKSDDGEWFYVGFDASYMTSVETTTKNVAPNYERLHVSDTHKDSINRCIPIEDVPKEEI